MKQQFFHIKQWGETTSIIDIISTNPTLCKDNIIISNQELLNLDELGLVFLLVKNCNLFTTNV